jgi:hypothetical protein
MTMLGVVFIPIIPTLGRKKQEFKASMSYIVRKYLNNNKTPKIYGNG